MKAVDVKACLVQKIHDLSVDSRLYSKNPERDFTRKRKLPFEQVVTTILGMGGGSLANELLDRCGCSSDAVTASAFVQQREKLLPAAMETLFHSFAQTGTTKLYNGLRLLAVDGSDVQISTNTEDSESLHSNNPGRKAVNILHLNAMYDLLQKTYADAIIQKKRLLNEHEAFVSMIDRSTCKNALVIADRGYESYNSMAHMQEKGWFYLIRVKDGKIGIARGLELPNTDEFDVFVDLSLTRSRSNEIKQLLQDRNHYKYMSQTQPFDYLPESVRGCKEPIFYRLPFRIVRLKISDNLYETLVTNLNAERYPAEELKRLYAMRWGIETSFRRLKYTIGLRHFHSKKVEYILQEVFARLIMYNFTELVASSAAVQEKGRKYDYRINFSAAAHICRAFFRGNVTPPMLEAALAKFLSPVRPGRGYPRRKNMKGFVSFAYRIA